MNLRLPTLVALAAAGLAQAQYMAPARFPPSGSMALTSLRFAGPTGMEATYYQGRARSRSFPGMTPVSLRPGYVYRMQLSNITNHPGLTIFPSVEVWGRLAPFGSCNCNGCEAPATIPLNPEDIQAILAGSLVTKVIYLEDPDRADPRPTKDGEILETTVSRTEDIYLEARKRGRIFLVVHFGGRLPTQEELAMTNVPGTILYPGENFVSAPHAPPCLPIVCKPGTEECLHDGGDRLMPVGFDSQGNIGGLDPEDTVAEYRDSAGRRKLVKSNRCCICVPRFISLRKELPLEETTGTLPPQDQKLVKRDVTIADRTPPLEKVQAKRPTGVQGKWQPSVNLNVHELGLMTAIKVLGAQILDIGPIEAIHRKQVVTLTEKQKTELRQGMKLVREFSKVVTIAGVEQIEGTSVTAVAKGLGVVSANVVVRDITICCCEKPAPPELPLILVKCADKGCAKPGDIVTFTLRYSNHGGRPLSDVAVMDNLSARLEYVPGSAESDRDAVFTTQENEVGSQILRWEVTGTLHPGDTGRVRFKVKVR